MRLLITGSRNWLDQLLIEKVFSALYRRYGPDVTLVSGACPKGADMLCEVAARKMGWTLELHPADWYTYGKAAGPTRNRKMVELGADFCVAFIRDNSPGASHCAALAEAAGIKTKRFTS